MARQSRRPPDIASLKEATSTFVKQTDRGAALVAGAWVDDALRELIKTRFRPDCQPGDELLGTDRPLGSFSARIKAAYCFGWIDGEARSDLEILRGIRNNFAHVREQVRFTEQSVKDRCTNLRAAQAYELGTGHAIRSPRQRFLITAFFLTHYLLSLAANLKPAAPVETGYTGPIRTAKSMVLNEMVAAVLGGQVSGDGERSDG
jgi:DNA-binding MltR family transcriptional regulator